MTHRNLGQPIEYARWCTGRGPPVGRSKWPPTTVPTRNRSDCERPSQTDVFPACLRAPGGHGLVTEWSRIFQNAPISVNIRRTGEPSRLFFDLHISTPTDTNWHRPTPPDSGSIPVHLRQTTLAAAWGLVAPPPHRWQTLPAPGQLGNTLTGTDRWLRSLWQCIRALPGSHLLPERAWIRQ